MSERRTLLRQPLQEYRIRRAGAFGRRSAFVMSLLTGVGIVGGAVMVLRMAWFMMMVAGIGGRS